MPAGAVDDVMQEAFIVVLRRIHGVEPNKERAFVRGVTAKISANWRRARQRRSETEGSGADPAHITVGSDTLGEQERHLQTKEGFQLLRSALGQMSSGQREVFQLCELEELSAREAGARLQLQEAAVVSRLRRARAAFKMFCTHHHRGPCRPDLKRS